MIPKLNILLIGIIFLFSCNTKSIDDNYRLKNNAITGTWKLISGMTIQKRDTTTMDYTKDQNSIKIINDSHFSFLRHDLSKGKDSTAIFVSGGGRYSLKGNEYEEQLEFCNYRE